MIPSTCPTATCTEADALFKVPSFFSEVIEILLVLALIFRIKFSFVRLVEKSKSFCGASWKMNIASSGALTGLQEEMLHSVFGPGLSATAARCMTSVFNC